MTSIHTIQAEVCRKFGINPLEMASPRRAAAVALPRQVAMYLCRALTPRSTPTSFATIARYFGDRDHTTVMHACKTVEQRLQIDPELAAKVDDIKRAIEEAA
jgi:chromosomal replication initiator protein